MKNILLGAILGAVLATGASLWAQSGPPVAIVPGNEPGMTLWNSPGGSGSILDFGNGISAYRDSAGNSGTIMRIPGGQRNPC